MACMMLSLCAARFVLQVGMLSIQAAQFAVVGSL